MEKLTRRQALRQMLGGAALAALPLPFVLPEEPVRRIWQVGAKLVRPTTEETLAYTGHDYSGDSGGLRPIEGQPGLFKDMATGQIVNIRDFRESDKWDTVLIPGYDEPEEPGVKETGLWQVSYDNGYLMAEVSVPNCLHGTLKKVDE